jgi:hypothetical protein
VPEEMAFNRDCVRKVILFESVVPEIETGGELIAEIADIAFVHVARRKTATVTIIGKVRVSRRRLIYRMPVLVRKSAVDMQPPILCNAHLRRLLSSVHCRRLPSRQKTVY